MKTNTVWYHLYVKAEKYSKLVTITKNKRFIDVGNKALFTCGERSGSKGNVVAGD